MNSSQIHLALTHVPVILSMVGFVVLVVAMLKRNDILARTGFYLVLFAGIFAVPVFFTGEGAGEIVEHLPGVSESVIEEHEELAKIAFGLAIAAALFFAGGPLALRKRECVQMDKTPRAATCPDDLGRYGCNRPPGRPGKAHRDPPRRYHPNKQRDK